MSNPHARALPFFQVDAFASRSFTGNPAAVCLLDSKLDAATMQNIAAEQNLSETAFVLPQKNEDEWGLRWFTPKCEIDLAGHPTLAAGFVLLEQLDLEEVRFLTKSGPLDVWREGEQFAVELPSHLPVPCAADEVRGAHEALGLPADTPSYRHGPNLLFLLENEAAVAAVTPDFEALRTSAPHLAMVTAKSGADDFVSRVFAPAIGVNEDPVTGSAHCLLAPFWSERSGRSELKARQLSARGGELTCIVQDDRVALCGSATLVVEGTFYVS